VGRGTAQGRSDLRSKESEQVHLSLGFRGFGRHDRRRYALKLLSVVLGENMSSRLFQRIREEEGLAYAIQTGAHLYADSGALILSAGLDRKRLQRAMRLAVAELARAGRSRVPSAELRRAKDYTTGQLRLGLEGTSGQMMWVGENLLAYGRPIPPEEAIAAVEAVTADEVEAVAAQLLRAGRSSLAVIGPDLQAREKRALLAAVGRLG
jgi:predicted Zn-dependent peptidase